MGLLVIPSALWAQNVERSGAARGDRETQLRPTMNGPSTTLRGGEPTGGLRPQAKGTVLENASGPQTVLREVEVPHHRLAQTRQLLKELKASATPQQDITIDLPADVLFDFDRAELRPEAGPTLAKAADLASSYLSAPLTVRGHTDSKGTDSYNDSLSLRRADAVARELFRLTGRQANVEGAGKRQPIAPNTTADGRDDPQGRQLNRRVQILMGLPASASR